MTITESFTINTGRTIKGSKDVNFHLAIFKEKNCFLILRPRAWWCQTTL